MFRSGCEVYKGIVSAHGPFGVVDAQRLSASSRAETSSTVLRGDFLISFLHSTTIMLRVGLSTSLFSPSLFQAAGRCRSQAFSRTFSHSTKPNVLQGVRRQPTVLSSSLLSKFSRSITNDAQVIVGRPSQAEAWKKFAITAARKLAAISRACN